MLNLSSLLRQEWGAQATVPNDVAELIELGDEALATGRSLLDDYREHIIERNRAAGRDPNERRSQAGARAAGDGEEFQWMGEKEVGINSRFDIEAIIGRTRSR